LSSRLVNPEQDITCWRLDLPVVGYTEAWGLQQAIVRARIEKKLFQDVFLFLEHHPVFTLGRRGGMRNLVVSDTFLKQSGIQVIQVERGGDITYHGPGQLVVYPILDLDRRRLGITDLVDILEEVMILVSGALGVQAERNPRNRGVWVGDKKLGSIGLAVRKGITFHGMALNVNLSMTPFEWIHPCGLMNTTMTSLEMELSQKASMSMVRKLTSRHLEEILGQHLQVIQPETLEKWI
jgi:lipoate-protein ligase B